MHVKNLRQCAAVLSLALTTASVSCTTQAESEYDITLRKGKQLYMLCQSCHATTTTSGQRIGPHLKGIYNRPVASVVDFNYSDALRKESFVWDKERLNTWLENPSAMVPGSMMSFVGISDEKNRAALIEYLVTLR